MGISNPQKKQKTPLGLGGEACDLSETARQRWHEPPWNTDGGFKTRYLFLLDFMAYFHKNPLYFWGVQNLESLYFWGVILFFIPIFFQQMFAGVWVGRNTSRVPNLAPILGCPKTEVDGSMVRINGVCHLVIHGLFLGVKSPTDSITFDPIHIFRFGHPSRVRNFGGFLFSFWLHVVKNQKCQHVAGWTNLKIAKKNPGGLCSSWLEVSSCFCWEMEIFPISPVTKVLVIWCN